MRSGGREAEGGGLLNRYTGLTRIGGSNPLHSAISSLLRPIAQQRGLGNGENGN
ncbi:MAG: hypothetical protein K0R63_1323 [Rickettsiales bacterium]|nr:hypothetical protein [Rickettsiales bacterium]